MCFVRVASFVCSPSLWGDIVLLCCCALTFSWLRCRVVRCGGVCACVCCVRAFVFDVVVSVAVDVCVVRVFGLLCVACVVVCYVLCPF